MERNYVYELIHLMVNYYGAAMHKLIKNWDEKGYYSLEDEVKKDIENSGAQNGGAIFLNIDAVKNNNGFFNAEEVIKDMDVQACSKLLRFRWLVAENEIGYVDQMDRLSKAVPNIQKEDIRKLRESIMHFINDRNSLMGHINEYTFVSQREFKERVHDIERIFRILYITKIDFNLYIEFENYAKSIMQNNQYNLSEAIMQDMHISRVSASKYEMISKEVVGEIYNQKKGTVNINNGEIAASNGTKEIDLIVHKTILKNKRNKTRKIILSAVATMVFIAMAIAVLVYSQRTEVYSVTNCSIEQCADKNYFISEINVLGNSLEDIQYVYVEYLITFSNKNNSLSADKQVSFSRKKTIKYQYNGSETLYFKGKYEQLLSIDNNKTDVGIGKEKGDNTLSFVIETVDVTNVFFE